MVLPRSQDRTTLPPPSLDQRSRTSTISEVVSLDAYVQIDQIVLSSMRQPRTTTLVSPIRTVYPVFVIHDMCSRDPQPRHHGCTATFPWRHNHREVCIRTCLRRRTRADPLAIKLRSSSRMAIVACIFSRTTIMTRFQYLFAPLVSNA